MDKNEVRELTCKLCYQFGVPVPLFIDVVSYSNDYIWGTFDFRISRITITEAKEERMLNSVYHEFRHCWQYQYYRTLYLLANPGVRAPLPRHLLAKYYQAIEADATHYGNCLGRVVSSDKKTSFLAECQREIETFPKSFFDELEGWLY